MLCLRMDYLEYRDLIGFLKQEFSSKYCVAFIEFLKVDFWGEEYFEGVQ